MTLLRKASWATMILAGLAVGCSGEPEPATTDATPATVAPKAEMPKIDPPKAEESKAEAPKTEEPKAEAPKVEAPKVEAPKVEEPKTASVKLSDDEVKEIKTLPAEEQVAALQQAKCPVSDEALGSMGTPIKVTAEGKTFYICCKGCTKEVEANPKEVVAKLAK